MAMFVFSWSNKYACMIVNSYTPSRAGMQYLRAKLRGRHVSITIDAWTSKAHKHYLGVTAHWIDSWDIKKAFLRAYEIPSQTAEAVARAVTDCIDQFGIDRSTFAIVTDGGANMLAAARLLSTTHGIKPFRYDNTLQSSLKTAHSLMHECIL
jgi:hypothetical protein